MARRSKIEMSPHYNEIVKLLLDGWGSRRVSNYLKNEYNESISHTAISNYRRDNLNVDEAVAIELQKQRKQNKEKTQPIIETAVKNTAEAQQSFREAVANGVTVRQLLQKILDAGPELWNTLLHDQEVSSDTKMKLVLQSAKLEQEWEKSTGDVEVNVNNDLSAVFDEDKVKDIVQSKRDRFQSDS